MDKDIRNRIQRATQAARSLLEDEYAEQLGGRFDIQLDGTVAAEPGAHLRDEVEALRVRAKLVTAVAHHRDQGLRRPEAVAALLRECAFTTLNRFVALKMLEARGIVQPCVSDGASSSGFREYRGLAGGLETLPDQGYRLYLDSLFDEVGREVRVLFDRRDPASLLWPRRAALDGLLGILNDPELSEVWGQDETIGWVYQYFNGEDERRQMRAESQAPRNSRELAVRNQFFTPRYVVEFLTDNTLARSWVEMRQGETGLSDTCRYLVKREREVFLNEPPSEGSDWVAATYRGDFAGLPEQAEWDDINVLAHAISGYRLACRLGFTEHTGPVELGERAQAWLLRARSGGWAGLTALQVWLILFYEARAQRHWGEEPEAERLAELQWIHAGLRERLLALEALEPAERPVFVPFRARKDPRDLRVLDPACGSGHFLLYSFDLLLTIYQEAWTEPYGPASEATGRSLRDDYPELPALHRALPGLILAHNLHGVDIDPRAAQIAALALWMRAQRAWNDLGIKRAERPLVRRTHIVVAEPMPGEADLLDELCAGLDRGVAEIVRAVFEDMKLAGEAGSLLCIEDTVQRGLKKLASRGSMFAAQDAKRWKGVEEQVYGALRRYAEEAGGDGYRRRLFAEDAARGFAFIEVCRRRYDIVLMNPPFGLPVPQVQSITRRHYRGAHNELFAAFVRRGHQLARTGRIGAITSRAFLVARRLEDFRRTDIIPKIELLLDLGVGVMDAAAVEAAAYVLGQPYADLLVDEYRHRLSIVSSGGVPSGWREASRSLFLDLPLAKMLYRTPKDVGEILKAGPRFEPDGGTAREGMKTFDNERFVRLWWEVPQGSIGDSKKWQRYAKGGENKRFWGALPLVLNWENKGAELRAVNIAVNDSTAQVRQASTYWGINGATYSLRATGFCPRLLPAGYIFSNKGPAVLANNPQTGSLYLLGWLSSRLVQQLMLLQGNKDEYLTGTIKTLPWREPSPNQKVIVEKAVQEVVAAGARADVFDESSTLYSPLTILRQTSADGLVRAVNLCKTEFNIAEGAALAVSAHQVDQLYGLDSSRWRFFDTGSDTDEVDYCAVNSTTRDNHADEIHHMAVAAALSLIFGREPTESAEDRRHSPFGVLKPPTCSTGHLALCDDPGHPNDIVRRVMTALQENGFDTPDRGEPYFRKLFRDNSRLGVFVARLLAHSTRSRKAPVYWRLGMQSGGYSIWLYIHRTSKDTLHAVLRDHVIPKLRFETNRLAALRAEAGDSPAPSQRKAIDAQEAFLDELRDFRDELQRVAPLWDPDLDDGVVINASFLHRLFAHTRSWQQECESHWKKLCAGDYDWAHLAMRLWPERVVPRCTEDPLVPDHEKPLTKRYIGNA